MGSAALLLALGVAALLPHLGKGQSCSLTPDVSSPDAEPACDFNEPPSSSIPWGGRGWEGGRLGVSRYGGMQGKPQITTMERQVSVNMRYNSPLVGSGGYIYVVTVAGVVYCLDFLGEIVWLISTGGRVEATPTLQGNLLVVASSVGLAAYDTRPGLATNVRKMWELNVLGGVYSTPTLVPAPDGSVRIFFTAENQNVFHVDSRGVCNGNVHSGCAQIAAVQSWNTQLQFTPQSEAMYQRFDTRCTAPNTLPIEAAVDCLRCTTFLPCSATCTYCEDQTLYGISPLRSTPAYSDKLDYVYVTAWDGLHALRGSDGTKVWHFLKVFESAVEENKRLTTGVGSERLRLLALSPVYIEVGGDVGDVVVFTSGSSMYAVDASTGAERWSLPNLQDFVSTPSFLNSSRNGPMVVVGTRDSFILSVRVNSGRVAWTHLAQDEGLASVTTVSASLHPIIDVYERVFFLSAKGIRALIGATGEQLWVERGCNGTDIFSTPALTDDGSMVVTCDDGRLRAFCCAECKAFRTGSSVGGPRGGQNRTFEFELEDIRIKSELNAEAFCVLDDRSNTTARPIILGEQMLSCRAPLLGPGTSVLEPDIAPSSFRVNEADVKLYGDCPLGNNSVFGASVKCGYTGASESLETFCRTRLQDSRAIWNLRGEVSGCELSIPSTIRIDFSKRPNQTCSGDTFTYWFPIVLNETAALIPVRIPKDYTDTIIAVVFGVLGFVIFCVMAEMYKRRRRRVMQRRQDLLVQRMYEYINSPDLDPHLKQALYKAKIRMMYGNILEISWRGWSDLASMGRLRRLFERVLKVRNNAEFDELRKRHKYLRSGDHIAQYARNQVEGGIESWVKARLVLGAFLGYAEGWADAWCAYLDGEIALYREQVVKRRRLYADARRASMWLDNHIQAGEKREKLWGQRHTHTLELTCGQSQLGPSVTKISDSPSLAVALGGQWGKADELVSEIEAVYFGAQGSAAVGVAHKGMTLSGSNPRQIFGKKSWVYLSSVGRYVPAIMQAALHVTIHQLWSIPWASLSWKGKTRPFVVLKLGEQVIQTGYLGGLHLHETAVLFVTELDEWITIEVRHKNDAGSWGSFSAESDKGHSTLLSSGRFSVRDLLFGTSSRWLHLANSRLGWGLSGGSLHLSVQPTVPLGGKMSRDYHRFTTEARNLFKQGDKNRDGVVATQALSRIMSATGLPDTMIDTVLLKANPWCTGHIHERDFINTLACEMYLGDQRHEARRIRIALRKTAEEPTPKEGPPAYLKPLLNKSPVFNLLGDWWTEQVAKDVMEAGGDVYQKEEILAKEGEEVNQLYLIISGRVGVSRDGREVAVSGAGDVVLEQACLGGAKADFTYTCLSSVTVKKIAKSLFFAQLRMRGGKASEVNTGNGLMIENGMVVQDRLGKLQSGDRIRMRLDRNHGDLTLWRNGKRLGMDLGDIQGPVVPCFALSKQNSSWSLCSIGDEEDRLVRVVVVGAENLPKMDVLAGTSDPYAVIEYVPGGGKSALEHITYKTKIMYKNLSPTWNEAFVFPHNHEDDVIKLSVWDHDFLGGNDIIGETSVVLTQIEGSDVAPRCIPLRDKGGISSDKTGVLRVQFEVSKSEEQEEEKENTGGADSASGAQKNWSTVAASSKALVFVKSSSNAKSSRELTKSGRDIRKGRDLQFRLWEGGSEGEKQVGGGWASANMGKGGSFRARDGAGSKKELGLREGKSFRLSDKERAARANSKSASPTKSAKGVDASGNASLYASAGSGPAHGSPLSTPLKSSLKAPRMPSDQSMKNLLASGLLKPTAITTPKRYLDDLNESTPTDPLYASFESKRVLIDPEPQSQSETPRAGDGWRTRRRSSVFSRDSNEAQKIGIEGLPGSTEPDPTFVRELFERVFVANLTPPQLKFFYDLWRDFEDGVAREKMRVQPPKKEREHKARQVRGDIIQALKHWETPLHGHPQINVAHHYDQGALYFVVNERESRAQDEGLPMLPRRRMPGRRGSQKVLKDPKSKAGKFEGRGGRFLLRGSLAGIAEKTFKKMNTDQALTLRSLSDRQHLREEERLQRRQGVQSWWLADESYKASYTKRSAAASERKQLKYGFELGRRRVLPEVSSSEEPSGEEDASQAEDLTPRQQHVPSTNIPSRAQGVAVASPRSNEGPQSPPDSRGPQEALEAAAEAEGEAAGEEGGDDGGAGVGVLEVEEAGAPLVPVPPAEPPAWDLKGAVSGVVAAIRLKKYVQGVGSGKDAFKNITEKTHIARENLGKDKKEVTNKHRTGEVAAALEYFSNEDEKKPQQQSPFGARRAARGNLRAAMMKKKNESLKK